MRILVLIFFISSTVLGQFVPQGTSVLSGHTSSPFTYYDDIQYGSTNKQTFDAFIPNSGSLTGAVFQFHGGGFVLGSKDQVYSSSTSLSYIGDLMDEGIAFFNFNYDLMEVNAEENGVINSLQSAQLGSQFVAYYASFFNLDTTKIIYKGSSAGAGISMWLGYQNDFYTGAPVLPATITTTNIAPVAVILDIPQATYDIGKWESVVFTALNYDLDADAAANTDGRDKLIRFYGIDDVADFYSSPIVTYRKLVDMLDLIDKERPVPTYLISDSTLYSSLVNSTIPDIEHSPYMGKAIRDALLLESIEVVSNINGLSGNLLDGETEILYTVRWIKNNGAFPPP